MRLPSILMRSLLLLLGSLSVALSTDPKYSETITLSYELVSPSSSKPSPLAVINYDPKSLRYLLTSWTPPSVDSTTNPDTTSAPLLRIVSPSGSSTVTTLSTFSTDLKQHINLYLSSSGTNLISASVTALQPVPLTAEEEHYRAKVKRAKARGKPIPPPPKPEKPKKLKKGASPPNVPVTPKPFDDTPEGQPKVNFVQELPPPTPKLLSRAPPAVDEQGNEVVQEEQAEKTFFQKYWWVIVGALVLTMGIGGGDK